MYGSGPCPVVMGGWCLMSHDQNEVTVRAGHQDLRLPGEFCKQAPMLVLFLSGLASDSLLSFLPTSKVSTLDGPSRALPSLEAAIPALLVSMYVLIPPLFLYCVYSPRP